jgi:hypothetical protein
MRVYENENGVCVQKNSEWGCLCSELLGMRVFVFKTTGKWACLCSELQEMSIFVFRITGNENVCVQNYWEWACLCSELQRNEHVCVQNYREWESLCSQLLGMSICVQNWREWKRLCSELLRIRMFVWCSCLEEYAMKAREKKRKDVRCFGGSGIEGISNLRNVLLYWVSAPCCINVSVIHIHHRLNANLFIITVTSTQLVWQQSTHQRGTSSIWATQ